ncbi:MAG: YidC/Oxa1 family membrane protein insertase [Minisyncoccia bacterium]|jgi:YidC/Oxa1 family membrane protein insertase
MTALFNAYIYQPILWLLIFIYQNLSFGDLGLAIIMLTVLVRVVLLPIFYKGARDQTIIQKIQPHVKKIQLDHKDDKERQAKELMELYKKHRVNPFSSILFLIIQLPIFIALFRVFTKEVGSSVFLSHTLFGLLDLSGRSVILAVVAAAIQYFQTRMMLASKPDDGSRKKDMIAGNQKMMMYLGPALTLIVLFNLPSAIGLYWTVSNVFSVGQQFFINKKIPSPEEKAGS